MRLSNRIAATALAAVMAVSMLTACGGGGGGSTGGNGGGNGGGSGNNGGSTSVAVPAPDKFENVGTGSESEGAGPALWVRRSQASAEASMQLLFRM